MKRRWPGVARWRAFVADRSRSPDGLLWVAQSLRDQPQAYALPPGGDSTLPRKREVREQIGPYEVLEELARGGQGAVLRARHSDLGTIVAIKVLLDSDPETRGRFQREGRTLARLRHPNLLRVDALGELPDGTPYMAMEFIRGRDLATWVRQGGATGPRGARSGAQ